MFDALWLYHCGYFHVPQALITPEAEAAHLVKLPFLALAGVHPEHGVVLVDAPFGHEGIRNVNGVLGALLNASMVDFKPSWSVVPRLEQMQLRPSQVEHVLMTHMHYDHTGGMKELGFARFHIAAREWQLASSLSTLGGLMRGYAISDYRALSSRISTFELPEQFDSEAPGHDLFGDGSVRAISLPGHAIGHTGYLFTLQDGRRIFHVGDAAFDLAQIHARQPLGPFPKRSAHDVAQTSFTLSELQRYHEKNQDVTLICSHDLSLGERCADGPILL